MVGTPSRSYLGVPIVAGDEAIGAISVQSTSEDGPLRRGRRWACSPRIAANVGVAIQNARLFEAARAAERNFRGLVEELPLAVYRDNPAPGATWHVRQPADGASLRPPPRARGRKASSSYRSSTRRIGTRRSRVMLWRSRAATNAGPPSTGSSRRTVGWSRSATTPGSFATSAAARCSPGLHDGHHRAVAAAAEIERQKQYFESLVEISPVAIVVMDADERVTGWNPAAAELFGYSAEEAIGRSSTTSFSAPTRFARRGGT